jgi:pyridoxine 5-phosphate synthase
MTRLSVNVNKVALLRNSRDIGIPNVLKAAEACIAAGADGITVHPRPEMSHIRPGDVYDLAAMLTVEFNIEGNPLVAAGGGYPGLLAIVRQVKPAQCTLVPDAPGQKTSDHGWDIRANAPRLGPIIRELRAAGVRVSLFVDADVEQIRLAADLAPDRVELYTAPYAHAFGGGAGPAALERYRAAAEAAQSAGLGVNAGHDLNLDNLALFCTIPGIAEVSIGHALISEALFMGLRQTVKAYLAILHAGHGSANTPTGGT